MRAASATRPASVSLSAEGRRGRAPADARAHRRHRLRESETDWFPVIGRDEFREGDDVFRQRRQRQYVVDRLHPFALDIRCRVRSDDDADAAPIREPHPHERAALDAQAVGRPVVEGLSGGDRYRDARVGHGRARGMRSRSARHVVVFEILMTARNSSRQVLHLTRIVKLSPPSVDNFVSNAPQRHSPAKAQRRPPEYLMARAYFFLFRINRLPLSSPGDACARAVRAPAPPACA